MKQCIKWPEDKFLAVRPCLTAICLGNKSAAKLLGVLLFRHNILLEHKEDAENQNAIKTAKGEAAYQNTSYRIFRTQEELTEDMCGEVSTKTLQETAIPLLQLLGFIDVEQHMAANGYLVDRDRVQTVLDLYQPDSKEQRAVDQFLFSSLPLEKFHIDKNFLLSDKNFFLSAQDDVSDKNFFLSNKKKFLSQLEEVLIKIRESSYQYGFKRGRRRASEERSRKASGEPKNREEDSKKNNKKGTYDDANASHTPLVSQSEDVAEDETTEINQSISPTEHNNPSLSAMPASCATSETEITQVEGVAPKETKKPRAARRAKPTIELDAEEQRVYGLYCHLWYNVDLPIPITATLKGHCATLAPFIKCQEEMDGLERVARQKYAYLKRKSLELGNLINSLSRWKQERPAPMPIEEIVPEEEKPLDTAESRLLERLKNRTWELPEYEGPMELPTASVIWAGVAS